jgi:hypothetical protein
VAAFLLESEGSIGDLSSMEDFSALMDQSDDE